ncbi:hypothetical protein AVEN_221190-1 [Araneus ventricosus]|uniref:Uncharacterized protein n=1 Tax=Araneus ventricosus TaxID=182803 RepID=A0A4Y2IF86_ARAVE|nr:hypothetical protein AVEN_221190-1 [Araneus ventricosus]
MTSDTTCTRLKHGGSPVESGLEPGTLRPRSRDLTTRSPRLSRPFLKIPSRKGGTVQTRLVVDNHPAAVIALFEDVKDVMTKGCLTVQKAPYSYSRLSCCSGWSRISVHNIL